MYTSYGVCIRLWPDLYMNRVGQNHVYTVHIRCFAQRHHQIYGHTWCVYTVLANPTHEPWRSHVCDFTFPLYISHSRCSVHVCTWIVKWACECSHLSFLDCVECIWNVKYEVWNMKYEIWSMKYEVWNMRYEDTRVGPICSLTTMQSALGLWSELTVPSPLTVPSACKVRKHANARPFPTPPYSVHLKLGLWSELTVPPPLTVPSACEVRNTQMPSLFPLHRTVCT